MRRNGSMLYKIAHNILGDREDSRESVNDTYLKAWDSIPPGRPDSLALYLGKLARSVSIDRYRSRKRKKRTIIEYADSLSELEEARGLFIGRYYYMDSVREAAFHYKMSESKARSMLHRIRVRLRKYLEQEGFL